MSGERTSRFGKLLRFDGLWRHPDFLRLWAGETISVFGSLIGRTALHFTAILVLDARAYEMAILLAAGIIPELLVGPVVGVWVDRLRRRPIMIVSDIGRALLLASIPLAYAFDALIIEQLYVVAFLTGVLTMWFGVAYRSYLPSLVRREELLEGNSKLTASDSVAEVGAFGVAGWLVQLLTAPVAIFIDAVSFLFSAVFVGLIRKPEASPSPHGEREGMLREAAKGLGTIVGNPVLRTIVVSESVLHLSFGIFAALFGLYVIRVLDFEPGVLGMIYAVGGASSLAGALFAGRAAARLGTGPAMIAGLAVLGASMMLVPLAEGGPVVLAAFLIAQQLGDGGMVVYDINQMTLRQTITEDRLLGRVNAAMEIAGHSVWLIGVLAGGLLGETIGLRATLVLGAGAMLVAALSLVLSPVRSLRAAPAPAEAELPPSHLPEVGPAV